MYTDDVEEPSSPDLIAPSPPAPAAAETEPMDVDQAPAASDNSAEPQRMQRKLVSKTYVNDEGYMGPLICIEYRLFVFVQFVVVISSFAKLIVSVRFK